MKQTGIQSRTDAWRGGRSDPIVKRSKDSIRACRSRMIHRSSAMHWRRDAISEIPAHSGAQDNR